MKVTKNKDTRLGFVVDSSALEELGRILDSANNEKEISVYLADGTSYEYNNIKDVLNLPNSKNRPIKKISFKTRFQEGMWALITLHGDTPFDTISYYLTGDEDKDVLYLADTIDEWICSIKPWYSQIATVNSFSFVSIWILAVYSVMLIMWVELATLKDFLERGMMPVPTPSGTVILVVIVILAYTIRSKMFPVSTFAIGNGLQRHNRIETWRKVFRAVILAIIVGVIVTLIVS
jgi:hypothetical protein